MTSLPGNASPDGGRLVDIDTPDHGCDTDGHNACSVLGLREQNAVRYSNLKGVPFIS